jgi:hypothetical protein
MSNLHPKISSSAGLTLIELVTSMVIASIASLGLGFGITSIVGFYQDDWVTKNVRFWGYECMDFLVSEIETAKKVVERPPVGNFDGLIITRKDGTQQLNIQGSETQGLLSNGWPILDYADFPSEGAYRENGQRFVELDKFTIGKLSEDEDFRIDFGAIPNITRLKESLWVIEMVVTVTTLYHGESHTEYVKFKRIAWAKDKYF